MDGIVYHLPRHMVEHWTHIHELNGMLVRYLNFIEVNFRAQHRLLNPQATPHNCTNQHEMQEQNKNEYNEPTIAEQGLEWINAGRIFHHTL